MNTLVAKMMTFHEKYQAIERRDKTFEGIFFTAVITTGIFCRPACTARKPKPENVIFYNTSQEAILNGFRPCKVCRPMELMDETPPPITEILRTLEQHPDRKIRDYELIQMGVEPSFVRRWFKKNHNMTFHVYQRMLRINQAYQKINEGQSVTETAFESGYNSLSGFNESFQRILGSVPSKSTDTSIVHIVRMTTPIGPMFACATKDGVCLLEFTDRKMLETELKQIRKYLNAIILPGRNKHLDVLMQQLEEYFEGKRTTFSVPLVTPGTLFQQNVWRKLQDIPFGQTRSYQALAIALDQPRSVRAVAAANGHNRISILIPCHRVIAQNGDLTGYGGGIARKRWLLELERNSL